MAIGHWSLVFCIDLYINLSFVLYKIRYIYFVDVPKFSIQWLHNFIDYIKLYWPLEAEQKKIFIYLNNIFFHESLLPLSVEIWTLVIYHQLSKDRRKKIPPYRIDWLKFIFLLFQSKIEYKFNKTGKILTFIESFQVESICFSSCSKGNGKKKEKDKSKFGYVMKIGQTKYNQSQFSTLQRIRLLFFDEHFFPYIYS